MAFQVLRDWKLWHTHTRKYIPGASDTRHLGTAHSLKMTKKAKIQPNLHKNLKNYINDSMNWQSAKWIMLTCIFESPGKNSLKVVVVLVCVDGSGIRGCEGRASRRNIHAYFATHFYRFFIFYLFVFAYTQFLYYCANARESRIPKIYRPTETCPKISTQNHHQPNNKFKNPNILVSEPGVTLPWFFEY